MQSFTKIKLILLENVIKINDSFTNELESCRDNLEIERTRVECDIMIIIEMWHYLDNLTIVLKHCMVIVYIYLSVA